MKVRIKFTKHGAMKFIGHLDIMRYFQKAMRRADVDIKYSEGFSPHQVMSFAAPLGVGLTSNGEYMDIEVNSMKDSKTMVRQLNEVMVEGIEVLSCRRLEDTAKNAMSMVAAADYTVRFRDRARPDDMDAFFEELISFYGRESIVITKKTKRGEREVDLKPLIYDLHREGDAIFSCPPEVPTTSSRSWCWKHFTAGRGRNFQNWIFRFSGRRSTAIPGMRNIGC